MGICYRLSDLLDTQVKCLSKQQETEKQTLCVLEREKMTVALQRVGLQSTKQGGEGEKTEQENQRIHYFDFQK
ncbi:hypothetical protein NQZ68_031037 [Dissostichus eleginoides]|nr:hypothetical protein NQZ68_031037 [Dissostichus eleginoides]